MKKRNTEEKSTVDFSKLIPIIKKIILALISGVFGFALNWIFGDRLIEGIITLVIVGLLCLAGWIVTCIYESKTNILTILQKDLKNGKNQEAVKLGCAVSRAMFLSGKNKERCLISERVIEALENIRKSNTTNIELNDKSEDVVLLKAKITIDDFGWSYYLCDNFKNKTSAENKVKEGIKDCLRYFISNSGEDKRNQVFGIIFKGLRHLCSMNIENFEVISSEELRNNTDLLNEYKIQIKNLGGFLGWLINDCNMYESGQSNILINYLINIFPEINLIQENFIDQFQQWAIKQMKTAKFALGTYNFRTKFYLVLAKICDIEGKDTEIKNNYLNEAKRLSLLMTVGYSPSDQDLTWISSTFSFGNEISTLINERSCFKCKDSERFVKGYVLLGTVAMAFGNISFMEEAKNAFEKAVEESKSVNRIDTYQRAQRKIISINERIFMYYFMGKLKSSEELLKDINIIIKRMDEIQRETKDFLGCPDKKMTNSCKERKKKYKKIIRQLKEN